MSFSLADDNGGVRAASRTAAAASASTPRAASHGLDLSASLNQPAVWSIIVSIFLIAGGTTIESLAEPQVGLTPLEQMKADRSGLRRFGRTIGWLCMTAGVVTILMASVVIPYRILRGNRMVANGLRAVGLGNGNNNNNNNGDQ
jgi:hypothetical protein